MDKNSFKNQLIGQSIYDRMFKNYMNHMKGIINLFQSIKSAQNTHTGTHVYNQDHHLIDDNSEYPNKKKPLECLKHNLCAKKIA
ncbi:hypothetical protein DERF_009561 [Dermatophagoides farinae]|uniref:Uncharacterized protein n=1 Tax=Dermatophagoides farinae TaxID=6954 RepID=A0A922L454_DERFA|nr:hypothetical protein DERF_009561 [Dermatophagoides farinae]